MHGHDRPARTHDPGQFRREHRAEHQDGHIDGSVGQGQIGGAGHRVQPGRVGAGGEVDRPPGHVHPGHAIADRPPSTPAPSIGVAPSTPARAGTSRRV